MVPVERASGDCDLLLPVLERPERRLCLRRRKIPLDVAPSSEELEDEDVSESLVDVELDESLVVIVVNVSVFVSVDESEPRRKCSASPTLSIACVTRRPNSSPESEDEELPAVFTEAVSPAFPGGLENPSNVPGCVEAPRYKSPASASNHPAWELPATGIGIC